MTHDYTGAVRQLMFNRMLQAVKLASIDGVTITRVDAKMGTVEGNLANVNFVVNVSVVPQIVTPEPE